MRLVLTGTPGTGKTTIAKAIARATEAKLIQANEIVKREALWFNRSKHEADLSALKRAMLKEIKQAERSRCGFVAEGHLLCEFPLPCDACVVLRCNPRELKKRLEARGYAPRKVSENVLCEILDYCLLRAEKTCGEKKIVQIDATRSVSSAKLLKKTREKKSDSTDWSSTLLDERFKNGLGLS